MENFIKMTNCRQIYSNVCKRTASRHQEWHHPCLSHFYFQHLTLQESLRSAPSQDKEKTTLRTKSQTRLLIFLWVVRTVYKTLELCLSHHTRQSTGDVTTSWNTDLIPGAKDRNLQYCQDQMTLEGYRDLITGTKVTIVSQHSHMQTLLRSQHRREIICTCCHGSMQDLQISHHYWAF